MKMLRKLIDVHYRSIQTKQEKIAEERRLKNEEEVQINSKNRQIKRVESELESDQEDAQLISQFVQKLKELDTFLGEFSAFVNSMEETTREHVILRSVIVSANDLMQFIQENIHKDIFLFANKDTVQQLQFRLTKAFAIMPN